MTGFNSLPLGPEVTAISQMVRVLAQYPPDILTAWALKTMTIQLLVNDYKELGVSLDV